MPEIAHFERLDMKAFDHLEGMDSHIT